MPTLANFTYFVSIITINKGFDGLGERFWGYFRAIFGKHLYSF